MRRLFTFALLLLVVLAGTWPGLWSGDPAAAQEQQADTAREVITAINAWRVSQGMWPLKPNATLTALALSQAEYLLTLADIPAGGAIHVGRSGEDIKTRAQWAPYNWPNYGLPANIAITEIANIGRNTQTAIAYWQGSAIHTRAVTNSGYREIGAAVLPHEYGHLFIVVMGSRPDVLPALVDPGSRTLYLTNEQFPGVGDATWFGTATGVQLFDGDGRPLTDGWVPWAATLSLPEGVNDELFVAYRDADGHVAASMVVFDTDRVLLPGVEPPETVAALTAPLPTATPTLVPAVILTPVPTIAFAATAAPIPTATPGPTFTPAPTTVPMTQADILVIYDSRSLTVANVSGQPVNLAGLELVSATNRHLTALNWQTAWLSFSLEEVPSRACLRVWSWNDVSTPPTPPECGAYTAVLNVAPASMFWTGESFEVRWQGSPLVTCPAVTTGTARCPVALP